MLLMGVIKAAAACGAHRAHDKLKRVLILLLSACFTSVATLCAQTFQSTEMPDSNGDDGEASTRFLLDPSVDFWGPAHVGVMAVAGVVILVFLLGVPLGIAWLARRLLQQDLLRNPEIKSAYGGIFDAYRDAHADFEAIGLLRRGVAVVAVVQLHRHPVAGAVVQIALSCAYLACVHSWRPFTPQSVKWQPPCFPDKQPYRVDVFNFVELAGTAFHLVLQAIALAFAAQEAKGGGGGVAPAALQGVCVAFAVASTFWGVFLVYRVWRSARHSNSDADASTGGAQGIAKLVRKAGGGMTAVESDGIRLAALRELERQAQAAGMRGSYTRAEAIQREYVKTCLPPSSVLFYARDRC